MKSKRKLPFDPKVFLSKVNGGGAISEYLKDELVFTQGEPADSVFYIQSGKVKKTVLSEQGKEAGVALLGTGDFFGEGCLTGEPLRLATVSAMTECVIVRISKADITRVIHKEPAFAELFIAHLLARTFVWKRIWSISCSIRARNGWLGSFCFWRILARKVGRSQS
jgi:CRP-like cAMP-binding protein